MADFIASLPVTVILLLNLKKSNSCSNLYYIYHVKRKCTVVEIKCKVQALTVSRTQSPLRVYIFIIIIIVIIIENLN